MQRIAQEPEFVAGLASIIQKWGKPLPDNEREKLAIAEVPDRKQADDLQVAHVRLLEGGVFFVTFIDSVGHSAFKVERNGQVKDAFMRPHEGVSATSLLFSLTTDGNGAVEHSRTTILGRLTQFFSQHAKND